jgi:hypothetical protein
MIEPDLFKEGILCLRCVQIESDNGGFGLLFVETESNVEALRLAAMQSPNANHFCARPVD